MELQELISDLEQKNTPESHLELGDLYSMGPFELRNIKTALEHYEIASQAGIAEASFQIGWIHSQDDWFKSDLDLAAQYLELTLKQDPKHLGASCALAEVYAFKTGAAATIPEANEFFKKSKELKSKAYKEIEKHPDEAHPQALVRLATAYADGIEVPEDFDKAEKYFKLAIDKGLATAYTGLGHLYFEGIGTEHDYKIARQYFEQGVVDFNTASLFNLGIIYLSGNGAERNVDKALELIQKSIDLGRFNSAYNLGTYYFHGAGLKQDIKKALELIEYASANGIFAASLFLAHEYLFGGAVEKDVRKAQEYFERACARGATPALMEYAFLSSPRSIIREMVDVDRYLLLIKKAAILQDPEAYFILGTEFLNGEHLPQHSTKGISFITKASMMGNLSAKTLLGKCFYEGNHVKLNKKKGLPLLREAANQGDEEALNYLAELKRQGKRIF